MRAGLPATAGRPAVADRPPQLPRPMAASTFPPSAAPLRPTMISWATETCTRRSSR
jgi:hypothetical protein